LRIYGNADGTGAYLDSIRKQAAADARVELMGAFPPGDFGRVLATADALAVPVLWYENAPLVVKAAQYIGLPVLASNIGTLPDSIKDGVNGSLLPPGDVEAWARALAGFRTQPLAQDFSIKSMDENARELFALYQEIIEERCSRQSI